MTTTPAMVNPLLTTLESQYPEAHSCEPGTHVIILGGGIDSRASSELEFERMSSATMARATAAYRIARNEPSLRLIAAGGVLRKASEAAVMANYLIAMGIDPQRIIKEAESRTTRENAENVALLLADQQVQSPVWLVTSALHMPRAVATFRQLLEPMGMHVCPVSVDKLALSNVPWWALIPQTTVIVKFDKWLHEILALGFYRLRGWI